MQALYCKILALYRKGEEKICPSKNFAQNYFSCDLFDLENWFKVTVDFTHSHLQVKFQSNLVT